MTRLDGILMIVVCGTYFVMISFLKMTFIQRDPSRTISLMGKLFESALYKFLSRLQERFGPGTLD